MRGRGGRGTIVFEPARGRWHASLYVDGRRLVRYVTAPDTPEGQELAEVALEELVAEAGPSSKRPYGSGSILWNRHRGCWDICVSVDGQRRSGRVHAPDTDEGRQVAERALAALVTGEAPQRRPAVPQEPRSAPPAPPAIRPPSPPRARRRRQPAPSFRPTGRYALHEVERRLGWPTAASMAEALGVSGATVKAWRVRGLSWSQADEVACRLLDCHPVLVWPEWLDDSAPATPPPRQSRGLYLAESGLDVARRLVDA